VQHVIQIEIAETFQYGNEKAEASLIATRAYSVGEVLASCSGLTTALTLEDEEVINQGKDFRCFLFCNGAD
jgi:hypothetical protein